MKNFWQDLRKPIFCLAPMANVTDCAFRQIIAKYGKPDVFWTEFVSADGLAHPVAREKLLIDLIYSENERPIVAQIFGSKGENIKTASALCKELGFDGIDINMGCPDRSIEKQCAGAAMMKNPQLAREIIKAAKEGGSGLPISVKTRLGYNRIDLNWIYELLKEDLAALMVHLRTRKEMSDVPAHWELMKQIVEIRNKINPDTLIIGNGDVLDIEDGRKKCEESGCDGVMLGRAIFGNPWLFPPSPLQGEGRGEVNSRTSPHLLTGAVHLLDTLLHKDISKGLALGSLSQAHPPYQGGEEIKHKLEVLVEHTKLFEKMLGKHKNFAIMKKHFKAYLNGFDRAKELRIKLMETENTKQVENIVNDFLREIR